LEFFRCLLAFGSLGNLAHQSTQFVPIGTLSIVNLIGKRCAGIHCQSQKRIKARILPRLGVGE